MRKLLIIIGLAIGSWVYAQELNCTVTINSDQIEGSNKQVFETLKTAIEEYTKAMIYDEFTNIDTLLPSDMILETTTSDNGTDRENIIGHIDLVRSVTGKDVTLVGSKVAIAKLQSTVPYSLWSNQMKDDRHNNQILGNYEGYDLMPLDRMNKLNTRESILDNSKIYIMPNDGEFKPIKYVV